MSAANDNSDNWCRHCRGVLDLTKEHLPPKSAGNADPISRVSSIDLSHPILDKHESWTDGHSVETLCPDCNHKASRWGFVAEYTKFGDFIAAEARKRCIASGGFDPILNDEFGSLDLPYDFMPRRFLAQGIGMTMAAQAEPDLANEEHLRAFIGADLPNQSTPPSATGLGKFRAYLALCNKDFHYARLPTTMIAGKDPEAVLARHWHFFFTPFAFCLSDSDQPPPWPTIDITAWADMGHHDRLPRSARHIANVPGVPGIRDPLFPEPAAATP